MAALRSLPKCIEICSNLLAKKHIVDMRVYSNLVRQFLFVLRLSFRRLIFPKAKRIKKLRKVAKPSSLAMPEW